MLTALLDANVLYSAPLRDFLIQLAQAELYRARWTEQIHAEWMRNVLTDRPDLARDRIERTRQLMDRALFGSLLTGFEPIVEQLQLPDPDDRHVLAAAIHGEASVIVTFNLRDFPDKVLGAYDIVALQPDQFLERLIGESPEAVVRSAAKCRARLVNPPCTAIEYIGTLRSVRLANTADFLQKHIELL